ncbi:MAG TPA: hypothetical protein VGR96_11765 [Acidobacteriaceae bacterium]|nr:hypothetical protein [Acidobacteriaceae bacterium]
MKQQIDNNKAFERHLSDWHIEELLIDSPPGGRGVQSADAAGWASNGSLRHLHGCDLCRSRMEQLGEVLSLYRQAAVYESEHALRAAPTRAANATSSLPLQRRHGLSWILAGWALALMLLVAAALPAYLAHRERDRRQLADAARNRLLMEQARDNLLLQQVDQEVTESVPYPLESLTHLVVASGSKDE